jgi:dUTP pyrophosphatase
MMVKMKLQKEKCKQMDDITVKIKITNGGKMPQYATHGSSGCDLHATSDGVIKPGERHLIKTGLFIEMPPGVEAQVRSRSGIAWKHGVIVLNGIGTIDSDYIGEIGVILYNSDNTSEFRYSVGDKIAQLVFAPVIKAGFELTEVITNTSRGEGGFGSTGV